jgi:hypothetical protein
MKLYRLAGILAGLFVLGQASAFETAQPDIRNQLCGCIERGVDPRDPQCRRLLSDSNGAMENRVPNGNPGLPSAPHASVRPPSAMQ